MANPWQTLTTDVQEDLAEALRASPHVWDQGRFDPWYRKYYPGSDVERDDVYPEWRFNEGLPTPDERNSLLCLYAKLKADGIWDQVKSIDWVGTTAVMLFWAVDGQENLQTFLKGLNFSDRMIAKHGDDNRTKKRWAWGLRSMHSGPQLHFRGPGTPGLSINVHIDLHTPGPGDTGLWHLIEDDWCRASTHKLTLVQAGLRSQHIDVARVQ
jgi:hypothetical protein